MPGVIHHGGLEVDRVVESSSFEGTPQTLNATNLFHWKTTSGGIEPRLCTVSNNIQVWT